MNTAEFNDLSTDEMEKVLADRRKAEKQKREQERKEYEEGIDQIVAMVMEEVESHSEKLRKFKKYLHEIFDEQESKLASYGKITKRSKGGFSMTHSSGEIRITRTRSTTPQWDERSSKAITLIEEFLKDTVKKKDAKLFEILHSFIKKGDKGELEYSKVMLLLSHQDKYDDPRWVEGLQLIKESYSIHFNGYGYDFFRKNEEGKFQKVDINFYSL